MLREFRRLTEVPMQEFETKLAKHAGKIVAVPLKKAKLPSLVVEAKTRVLQLQTESERNRKHDTIKCATPCVT